MNFPKLNETILVGFKKFNTKKGQPCCLATIMSCFSDREMSYGAVGYKCEDIFIPSACHNEVNANAIGKQIEVKYEINAGKAYVRNVEIL